MIKSELIACHGSDEFIASMATMSTGKNLCDERKKELIGGLVRARHAVPFEFTQIIYKLTCPVGIMTQVVRHRAFSVVQASTRYKNIGYRSVSTGDVKLDSLVEDTLQRIEELMIGDKRQRELACMALPRGLITEAVVSVNLRGLANFFRLRLNDKAQEEIKILASEMLKDLEFEGKFVYALRALEGVGWVL